MTQQKTIRVKVSVLELAKQLGNVSQRCRVMGYSRDSFYRFKNLRNSTTKRRDRGAASAVRWSLAINPMVLGY